jgi:hypothetical protein
MLRKSLHLSDQELLLWADGEVSSRRAAEIQRHVSACWTCRARMAELERAIADFIHLYRGELDAKLPPVEGPRALLKARLAERAAATAAGSGNWFIRAWQVRAAGALAALLLMAGIATRMLPHGNPGGGVSAVPNVSLTPGATNPIGVQDICSVRFSSNDPEVPDALKREVWKEYGLNDVSANAYEIDYLVTPQLGGATNIRNLWPQSSLNTVWNARVKDALEDRLHNMVCSGQLDLATAQREISQDWVAAYKKHFRTKTPVLAGGSPGIFKM